MIAKGDEILAAICGPSRCGKTTLAFALVAWLWRVHRLRSIVFDPFAARNRAKWGHSAWVTSDLEAFRRAVWGTKDCAVLWDESSDSLDRNAKEDKKFFTRIRHEHRALIVLMHDFTVLTPLMRGNLSDAWIFRQTEERAENWVSLFADKDLRQTAELERFEFVHKRGFCPVKRYKPSANDLKTLNFIP